MKILQVFNQYRFRGGEEAWVDSLPKLLGDSAIVDELRFHSDDWTGPNRPSLLQQARWIGNNPASRLALRNKVESFRPDVLLFHNVIPVGSLGLYEEANKLGIPVLQYTHNFRPFSPGGTLWNGHKMTDAALHGNSWPEILSGAWQGSRIKTAILAWHLKQARRKGLLEKVGHWLAVSEFMRLQFVKAGIPENRITTLRHCYDCPAQLNETAEGNHYLFMGRLVPEKGIHSLIEAWRTLDNELGESCPKLVIAGTGPMEAEIKAGCESLRHVDFHGFIRGETKQSLIQSARSIIVPSICWESLGLTVYEAFAYGRPAIVSKAGALEESVEEEFNGWLHEPGSSADILRAVMKAEKIGSKARKVAGENGYRWLQKNADPAVWRNHFISLCQKVVHSSKTNKV